MQPFFEHSGHRFHRQAIIYAHDFVPAFGGKAYPCLVWNHGEGWAVPDASALAARLLDSNCRYVVSAGAGCERLHDVVDQVFVHRCLDRPEAESEAQFVMTTWHTDKPVDDTTFFFAFCTSFDDHDFSDFLLLHVGGTTAQHAVVEASLRKEVVDAEEP
jgi:hypothetical protein